MVTTHPADLPDVPPQAARAFGSRTDLAEHFTAILATTGVDHGLVGPREVPRLWSRHVLNCAVVAEAVPQGARVIDVGSGAGLPGVVLAIARPDAEVVLVEPLLRRTTWLNNTVSELGLDNVEVRRGKAAVFHGKLDAPIVTARAVARLDRLAEWCIPLVAPGGALLALKGASGMDELDETRGSWGTWGVVDGAVLEYGAGIVEPPTTVVRLDVGAGNGARHQMASSKVTSTTARRR